MNQYCIKCGNMTKGNRFCSFCGADQQPSTAWAPTEYIPPHSAAGASQSSVPTHIHKPILGLVAIITAAVVVVVCTASYFLFFSGESTKIPSTIAVPASTTEAAITEAAENIPAEAVDYAATRDVADLVGVWAGTLEYTEISGDWEAFTYPVSEGYGQPFMLKITQGSPELNWREAILNIDGGDAAVLIAGFEGRFLEIRGEWQSCDVSISVEFDETRGGFAGIGEYIHPEKHAVFDFFMASSDESAWDIGDISAATEPQPPAQTPTVSDQTITVDEVAEIVGTINYEILCHLNNRLPRFHIN